MENNVLKFCDTENEILQNTYIHVNKVQFIEVLCI